ncbi:MAG TPA: response regulator [Polyangiaceae bacterium]|nr:response regulator [Polyangiaceae bacterium]
MKSHQLICVVDDDESVREALEGLLRQVGYAVEVFESGEAFLRSDAPLRASCVLLDVHMPGMNGPAVQVELSARGHAVPVIIITAIPSDALESSVLGNGAVAMLVKPFAEELLLATIRATSKGEPDERP